MLTLNEAVETLLTSTCFPIACFDLKTGHQQKKLLPIESVVFFVFLMGCMELTTVRFRHLFMKSDENKQ